MSNTEIVEAQPQRRSLLVDMAHRFGMEPAAFEATVRATCMKPDRNGRVPTREEFAAFLLVAKEHNLNPLTKEIYAFPDKGGIIPIVGVDGWARIINSHPMFDGMDFDEEHDERGNLVAVSCRMHRKDRSNPTIVTEYLEECRRDTDPWKKWPRRMLRHKAMIQAGRMTFGFSGIYDPDEADRIRESRAIDVTPRVSRIADRLSGATGQGFSSGHVEQVEDIESTPVSGQPVDDGGHNEPDPDAPANEATDAFVEGWNARNEGLGMSSMPKDLSAEETADWIAGWKDADHKQKERR